MFLSQLKRSKIYLWKYQNSFLSSNKLRMTIFLKGFSVFFFQYSAVSSNRCQRPDLSPARALPPQFWAGLIKGLTRFANVVDGPFSQSSAYSHHGCLSRVQNPNGMPEIHLTFVLALPIFTWRKSASRTPSFREAYNVGTKWRCFFRHLLNFSKNVSPLISDRWSCRKDNWVLNCRYLIMMSQILYSMLSNEHRLVTGVW